MAPILTLALVVALLLTPTTAHASAHAAPAKSNPATASVGAAAATTVTAKATSTANASATSTAKTTATPTPVPSPKKAPPPAPGHSAWPGRLAITAAILALLALAGVVARRRVLARAGSRQLAPDTQNPPQIPAQVPSPPAATFPEIPRPPRGATVAPPVVAFPAAESGRQAIVCTELHPHGYVEIDRCLYRAVWTASDQPPPAPGLSVIVAQAATDAADAEVLFAFPPLAQGSSDAR